MDPETVTRILNELAQIMPWLALGFAAGAVTGWVLRERYVPFEFRRIRPRLDDR